MMNLMIMMMMVMTVDLSSNDQAGKSLLVHILAQPGDDHHRDHNDDVDNDDEDNDDDDDDDDDNDDDDLDTVAEGEGKCDNNKDH